MAEEFFRQCFLHRGNWRTTTWLPEKLAKVGQAVSFREVGDDWTVAAVYQRVEKSKLPGRHRHDLGCFGCF